MAGYSTVRAEYTEARKTWIMVKDCVKGARAVRAKDEYLPKPDPTDTSPKNLERYKQLKARAMYLNVTGRTKVGLVGAVFRKTAEVDLPTSIAYLNENATGEGQSLEQFCKDCVGECLETARGGILADFPAAPPRPDGAPGATLAETRDRQAFLRRYDAINIINWREQTIGNRRTLVLVVLHEKLTLPTDDGFGLTEIDQYRALKLVGGRYEQWLYDDENPEGVQIEVTDSRGEYFDHIPFYFFGAENNDTAIDKSPLEDLADVNLLHYGNSATVEESGFISSQPTFFFTSDLDKKTSDEWNPDGMQIGSRRGYYLGKVGTAKMEQAKESQLARTLMLDKENQMLMIGARIIMPAGAAETAEAARIRYSSDNSVLGTIAGNVSEAVKSSLLDAMRFMDSAEPNEDSVVFWLNQQFYDAGLDAPQILALVQLWQQGIVAKSDVRTALRQGGIVEPDRSDEDIDDELDAEPPVSGSLPPTNLPPGAPVGQQPPAEPPEGLEQ